MTSEEIVNELRARRDESYRDFQSALIPTVKREAFIGVRTPALRLLAKSLSKSGDVSAFLTDLPHAYFDEDQLHAFLISEIKDFDRCLAETERFLPYVNNWATCDQMSPKVFKKHKKELLAAIDRWLLSERTYTVRFALGMLMTHFLDEDFSPVFLEKAAAVRSEEYYVKMMVAWYFATALAKQYDAALPYLERKSLDPWTHNKAIRKALESFRISPEHKAALRRLSLPSARLSER
ncbi:MAG: DNA alkylation repair protein [Clostridia bacterium]|nr:DNA alkylation repair protein [Clostridia bacterium]